MAESTPNSDTVEIEAVAGTPVELPQGFSLADAEITRVGNDLILVDADGKEVIVRGYFSLSEFPPIVSTDGTQLTGSDAVAIATQTSPTTSPTGPTGGDNGDGQNTDDGDDDGDGDGEEIAGFDTASGEEEPPAPPAPEITGLGLPQGDAPDQFLGPEGGQIDPLNLEIDPPTEPGGTEIARVDQSGNDSGNSGNDGASTGGGESTVSPTSTIVNTRPTANDDYQNGGGAQGDVVSGNVIAGGGADIDAEANDLSLLDVTFEGTTYSFEGDGQTDEGGTFVNVTGNNGCSAPGSLDTSLSHAAGLIEIAVCHA